MMSMQPIIYGNEILLGSTTDNKLTVENVQLVIWLNTNTSMFVLVMRNLEL